MDESWDPIIKIAAIVVAVLTYVGSKRRELRIRRAELVRAYTNDFYADTEFLALFMDIDYDRLGRKRIAGSDRELLVIRLLDFLNAMGHNWRKGVLGLEDLIPTTLGYATLRVWENASIREYLQQIKLWDDERYVNGSGFRYFEELAIEIAFLSGRLSAAQDSADLILSAPVRRRAGLVLSMRYSSVRTARRLGRRLLSAVGSNPPAASDEDAGESAARPG